jgi:hypothetical protein
MNANRLYEKIKGRAKPRSTFGKAVLGFAEQMLESICIGNYDDVNGESDVTELNVGHLICHKEAEDIPLDRRYDDGEVFKVKRLCREASYGGNFDIYTDTIVENLYPPSKRTRKAAETCLDKQADALYKAVCLVKRLILAELRANLTLHFRELFDWATANGLYPSFSPSDEFGPVDHEKYFSIDGFCFGDENNKVDGPMVYGSNDATVYNDGSYGYALANGTIYGDHKGISFMRKLMLTYKEKGLRAAIEFARESGDKVVIGIPAIGVTADE